MLLVLSMTICAPAVSASLDPTATDPLSTAIVPERIAGATRYGTSAEVATSWPSGVETAFVVSGSDYPDALTGAARAGALDVPVLLTRPTGLPVETRRALRRLQPEKIVVVGGQAAVSKDLERVLSGYATAGAVQRLSGPNRYATAARVASQYQPGGCQVEDRSSWQAAKSSRMQ